MTSTFCFHTESFDHRQCGAEMFDGFGKQASCKERKLARVAFLFLEIAALPCNGFCLQINFTPPKKRVSALVKTKYFLEHENQSPKITIASDERSKSASLEHGAQPEIQAARQFGQQRQRRSKPAYNEVNKL